MKVELVDLEEFSGNKAHIYSVLLDDAEDTLFDQFVEENGPLPVPPLQENHFVPIQIKPDARNTFLS